MPKMPAMQTVAPAASTVPMMGVAARRPLAAGAGGTADGKASAGEQASLRRGRRYV